MSLPKAPYPMLVALLLMLVLMGGCHARQVQTKTYIPSYNAIMFDYRDKMVQLASRPLPPRTMPASRKAPILAANLDDVAQAEEGFVRRIDMLTPPAPYSELHNATRNMMAVSATGHRQCAVAMRTRNMAAVDTAFKNSNTANRQAIIRMVAVTKAAGLQFAGASQQYEQVLRHYQEK